MKRNKREEKRRKEKEKTRTKEINTLCSDL
jgi:hypothetical protein